MAWSYLGGDEEADADEDGGNMNSVMEASIGDYLHDDVHGRVQLVADHTAEGDLIIRLEDGEEKRRTCGHIRTIPPEAGPTLPACRYRRRRRQRQRRQWSRRCMKNWRKLRRMEGPPRRRGWELKLKMKRRLREARTAIV